MCKGPGEQTVWSLYSRKGSHKERIVKVLKYHLIFNKTAFKWTLLIKKKKKNSLFFLRSFSCFIQLNLAPRAKFLSVPNMKSLAI